MQKTEKNTTPTPEREREQTITASEGIIRTGGTGKRAAPESTLEVREPLGRWEGPLCAKLAASSSARRCLLTVAYRLPSHGPCVCSTWDTCTRLACWPDSPFTTLTLGFSGMGRWGQVPHSVRGQPRQKQCQANNKGEGTNNNARKHTLTQKEKGAETNHKHYSTLQSKRGKRWNP